MKIQSHLKSVEDEDDLIVSIQDIPKIQDLSDDESGRKEVEKALDVQPEKQSGISVSTPEYPAPDTVRHDWFQMGNKCDVSIFIKNSPKEDVTVEFTESSATIKFPLASGQLYEYNIGPFSHEIEPSKSTCKVFSTKIELGIVKKVNTSWATLLSPEGERPLNNKVPLSLDEMRTALEKTAKDSSNSSSEASTTNSTRPLVPSFEKNWEKMAAEALGDEEQQPDDFFKQLYGNADDDTRKAMLKSYTESGGTTLSTNWEDVKKAPVPVSPPSGMEAKKF
ncbi:Sgt1p [Sugiyamaella lignohabitans]|uniref:Sgt1p n=1 Tax=Sugiyamaella lignohabitans TaxID=796027 RepID=A0A161HGP4_9ASCO|nr:Sgt1p [Sugiyamaella lignohabitans]ANB11027.1 Sgt1p [Sugiyamaella lignohabitans]